MTHSNQSISPLRLRMIDDMTLRRLAPKTQAAYLRAVVKFTTARRQARLDREPERMRARRETVEHPFGTIKSWMGSTHFLTRGMPSVSTEMSLHVMAYNLKRMMNIFGVKPLIEAIQA